MWERPSDHLLFLGRIPNLNTAYSHDNVITRDALEWLAAMCYKGELLVRYYGYYSNVSSGKRKKQDLDDVIPSILEPDG